MKQEDKELLIQDLSARQIYGVKALISSLWNKDKESEECITDSIYCVMRDGYVNTDTIDSDIPIENVKPYLRPMSSMTEIEKMDFNEIQRYNVFYSTKGHYTEVDWLNAHHFDYRGLIERGLALEAPERMYK